MVPSQNLRPREQIKAVVTAFEARDAEGAAEMWADDGVFIDPHYPEPEYRGPEEIRDALDWALEHVVEQPRLTIRDTWSDGESIAVEVNTHHVAHDGTVREFPQVFIVEADRGQITRWQSYLPFPPSAETTSDDAPGRDDPPAGDDSRTWV